jgi:protein-S-isoprenylcysteine O-methyltransferase Ste14
MKPYFEANHLAGVLLLIVALAWLAMELGQGSKTREGAVKVGWGGGRVVVWACIIATNVTLYLTPHLVPAAAIRPGAVAFAVGLVLLMAGAALRGWSFRALGECFTFTVMVSADQPVVTAGPYRLLRHPSYTGILLACSGVGLTAANWAGLAAFTVIPLACILWRIHTEETALLATVGDRYRSYASGRKRLVPLIW